MSSQNVRKVIVGIAVGVIGVVLGSLGFSELSLITAGAGTGIGILALLEEHEVL